MNRNNILIALGAAALGSFSATSAVASSSAKHTDRLDYRNVEAIVLDNTQGHVHITAGHGTGITIERTTETLLTKSTSSAYLNGHVLHLNSVCHGAACQVDYRINTPAGVRFQITERNATVSITGTPGDLAATNTDEGDLTFDLTKAPRQLRATTHHGAIAITVPRGPYAVTARADDGNKTITGITVRRDADHTLAVIAKSGNITIKGR